MRDKVNQVIIHSTFPNSAWQEEINQFHVYIIEKYLNNSEFTNQQKITIIDKIITDLKSREENGLIH